MSKNGEHISIEAACEDTKVLDKELENLKEDVTRLEQEVKENRPKKISGWKIAASVFAVVVTLFGGYRSLNADIEDKVAKSEFTKKQEAYDHQNKEIQDDLNLHTRVLDKITIKLETIDNSIKEIKERLKR